MQSTDTQLAHADFVLLNLAQQVADAEEAVHSALRTVQSIAGRVQSRLTDGAALNSLGELQANGAALDAAAARLEQSVKAFTQAHSYLGRGFPNQGKQEANECMQSMFDAHVRSSARLQSIVR